MTEEQYYYAVRRLGLLPSDVPDVFRTTDGDCYNVPDAARYTPEQRQEIIDKLRMRMGAKHQ